MGLVARVCQPSIFLMMIWPEAIRAQNNMAAVAAEGSTVWVLMRRLNSSCSRSMQFVVRALRHWLGGSRAKANRRVRASSRLGDVAMLLLAVIGVREDGQKVLLAVKAMGGESTEAWRAVL